MSDSGGTHSTYRAAAEAAEAIRRQHAEAPHVAIVLGTGLGGLADRIAAPTHVPYGSIPHFPHSTVVGHAGRLVLGRIGSVPVAAMQGRFHLYEGYALEQVVLPVRTLRLLGAEILIVTNAAGGLDPSQQAGDLMLVRDHIGLPTMAGRNPLVGPNDERLGPRFPAMTNAYDAELAALAREVAAAQGTALREGVYAMVSGPNYESPAELRFLRAIGADAVGMSTVPEVIAARHLGMRVLAISVITNVALAGAEATPEEPSHLDVVATAEAAGSRLAALIEALVEQV